MRLLEMGKWALVTSTLSVSRRSTGMDTIPFQDSSLTQVQEARPSNHPGYAQTMTRSRWPPDSNGSAFWTLYFLCSAIRSNVGLAQTMNIDRNHDLGSELNLTPKQISTGLALFYVCYVLFDLPSNLIMTRLSPRVWMSRIVIAVGIIGSCMAAMKAAWSF